MALNINVKLCKGCGICVEYCPTNVLALDEIGKVYIKNPSECIYCGRCEIRCPDFAIILKDDNEEARRGDNK